MGDVASVVFRDRFGCWAFLDLWRIGAAARFTAEEAAFLSGVAPPVAEALRRAQARTFELIAPVTARGGPVVLVLSPDLEVRAQTAETERYLRVLMGVHRLEERIQQAVAEPPVGQHSVAPGLEP